MDVSSTAVTRASHRSSRVLVAVFTLAVLTGCNAHGPVDESRPVVTERPTAAAADHSIEPGDNAVAVSDVPTAESPGTRLIVPISLSQPPADAARAFEICAIRGWVDRDGIDVIAGIGRIDHAYDAARYVRLTGREPELQSDQPAWIVQFRGQIRMAWSNTVYVDPACIVVDGGDGGFFGTGATREVGSNVTTTPRPVPTEPDRLLPPPRP